MNNIINLIHMCPKIFVVPYKKNKLEGKKRPILSKEKQVKNMSRKKKGLLTINFNFVWSDNFFFLINITSVSK